ncbi:MAG: hypothetical protein ACI37Z_02465 [Candidatus Gastranaerophilaceae bacterium]
MKKQVLILVSVVVIVCSFVACTHNSGSETASTTAITDSNGITHYYKPVTDENKDIVTKENGEVITTEITVQSKAAKTQTSSTSAQNEADNVIDFNTVTDNSKITTVRNNKTEMSTEISTDETTTQINTTTPQKQTQPITDKDGWINKWY